MLRAPSEMELIVRHLCRRLPASVVVFSDCHFLLDLRPKEHDYRSTNRRAIFHSVRQLVHPPSCCHQNHGVLLCWLLGLSIRLAEYIRFGSVRDRTQLHLQRLLPLKYVEDPGFGVRSRLFLSPRFSIDRGVQLEICLDFLGPAALHSSVNPIRASLSVAMLPTFGHASKSLLS